MSRLLPHNTQPLFFDLPKFSTRSFNDTFPFLCKSILWGIMSFETSQGANCLNFVLFLAQDKKKQGNLLTG